MDNNTIPQAAIEAIEEVIQKDEGGWKLTANKDDPDGGWTYGGCTKKLLASKYAIWATVSFEEMQEFCGQVNSDTNNRFLIYRVYYEEFYVPLAKHNDNYVPAVMLSCAVNCGVQTAIDIAVKSSGSIKIFCHQWLLHYAELVRKNAQAWRYYATQILKAEPATLRAENLSGWINRVMRYMP